MHPLGFVQISSNMFLQSLKLLKSEFNCILAENSCQPPNWDISYGLVHSHWTNWPSCASAPMILQLVHHWCLHLGHSPALPHNYTIFAVCCKTQETFSNTFSLISLKIDQITVTEINLGWSNFIPAAFTNFKHFTNVLCLSLICLLWYNNVNSKTNSLSLLWYLFISLMSGINWCLNPSMLVWL